VSETPVTEQEANLSVTVVRTADKPGNEKGEGPMTQKTYEDTIALSQELRKDSGPRARITMSRSAKVTDAVQWGPGTFDKINYTVDVFASVSLECDQDNQTIRTAQNIAYALAWEASRKHLQHAVVSHYDDIRNVLYSGYFTDQKVG